MPDLIVIHYTAMQSHSAALERLCDAACEVSAHYLIGSDGSVLCLVEEEHRAWHAGAGGWGDVSDVNSRSIGIELSNGGASPFAAAQMDALEGLLGGMMARWSIRPERVIGHSDMAPERKQDPGPRFDWRRLALGGLSVWPEHAVQARPDAAVFLQNAHRFGYRAKDAETALLAFRARFRPGVGGALDKVDMGAMAELAQRFPVDLRANST
ncbi:MAG: N-acetylmuramoyl-L-alanine amidase [Marinosulfonomonas sp.]|nr:N-acetylmuramoyl-L-alanine amidase [Marinosulfonomonas sp.]